MARLCCLVLLKLFLHVCWIYHFLISHENTVIACWKEPWKMQIRISANKFATEIARFLASNEWLHAATGRLQVHNRVYRHHILLKCFVNSAILHWFFRKFAVRHPSLNLNRFAEFPRPRPAQNSVHCDPIIFLYWGLFFSQSTVSTCKQTQNWETRTIGPKLINILINSFEIWIARLLISNWKNFNCSRI